MKNRTRAFSLYCKTIDFGKVDLSKMERVFYHRFSKEILSLCRSLPPSAQTDAILFLMKYSGIALGDELDFFSNYYPPTWSILYWLTRDFTPCARRLENKDVRYAVTAQSMAMFLHSLDDHLTDRQVPVSALTLLLRTRAWTMMDRAFLNLADGVPAGRKTIQRFLDDYYSSIRDSKGLKSLDSYCDLFRRQMGIGMIAPTLLSMKMTGISDFAKDIETAYGSFGIAWRLLDDIRDIHLDIEKGSCSAIYLCLPKKVRTQWNKSALRTRAAGKDLVNAILNHIDGYSIIDRIRERICAELEKAASIVEAHDLTGLALEFRCLAHPVRNSGGRWEERHGKPGISLAQM